jgi:hypothetical protein
MKIKVQVTHVRVETCEIEVEDMRNVKGAVEALIPDNFRLLDENSSVEVFNGEEDITGDIQPYCPNL